MRIVAVTVLLFLAFSAVAQKWPAPELYRVRISSADSSMVFETVPVSGKPRLAAEKIYYWYSANSIHTTQGGYSGKLLNGNFSKYYPTKALKQQGLFKKGLPDGQWKYWDETGKLQEVITWDAGEKNGEFQLYDSAGRLKQSGSYHHGLLHGEVITYNAAGTAEKARYRDGKVIPVKPPLWKRLPLLKKKQPKTTAKP